MTSPALALQIDNLDSGYGRTQVLRRVSVAVPKSSIVAVLGSNGAGKTTLLRTIAGLIRPDQGRVHLHGHDVTSWPVARRAKSGLALIPEGKGVFRGLTVRENLTIFGRSGSNARNFDRALEVFPALAGRLDIPAGVLSGGQRQMLALCAGLLRESTAVLVDEASFGLAPSILEEVLDGLTSLRDSGTSLLVVDQRADKLLAIADRVLVMRKGEVTFNGDPADLSAEGLEALYMGASSTTRVSRGPAREAGP